MADDAAAKAAAEQARKDQEKAAADAARERKIEEALKRIGEQQRRERET